MNNRNTILFMVGTLGLFAIYWLVMQKFYPQPAQPPVVQQEVAKPAPQPSQPQAASSPAPAPAAAAPADAQANVDLRTFQMDTRTLALTWRVSDGSLQQVKWIQDGTPFLPETRADKHMKAFPGIGGTHAPTFTELPEVRQDGTTRTVTFRSQAGDVLTYVVPEQGHVLQVSWDSARRTQLALLRQPADPEQATGLSRVFSIQDKGIQAVTWSGILTDPWFSSLGRKRDVLPPAASRVGMDAGLTPKGEPASTQFFAVIWELDRVATREAATHPGYLAPSGSKARLYLGPKQAEALEAFGKPYGQVMDFGFFGVIAKFMFWVLRTIYTFIPNWGWTLVLFAVLIRVSLWSLNTKSTIQMLRMKDFEPHQKAIQAKYEKYGNDMTKKAEMQKELMAFYKKNGHNPMGGCWPMLLQMPVFLALFSMVSNVFELRGAPWMFWIKDLSSQDPYMILPIILGVTMFVQSKMTPSVGDEMQKKMMTYLMPAMMIFFFKMTPAGLCLYYLVYNLVHIFHTWLLLRSYKPQPVVI